MNNCKVRACSHFAILAIVIVMAAASMALCTSNDDDEAKGDPRAVLEWRSHDKTGFFENGCGGSFIYATSGKPRQLDVWEWKGDSLSRSFEREIPEKTLHVVWVESGLIALTWGKERPSSVGLFPEGRGEAKVRWEVPKGWTNSLTQPSANGKYVGVVWGQDVGSHLTPRSDWDHEKTRIGIIGPARSEIVWTTTLVGPDASYNSIVRVVRPSNDGKYVAIAGYGTKLTMVDVAAKKQLWIKRPPGEVGLEFAEFSPDSSIVYTGGTSAAVYTLDVRSGKVLDKWYASPTGNEIYGHRISCLAVSPNGKWVAAGTGPEGVIFVGSTEEAKVVATLKHGGSTVSLVQFSPGSTALASVGYGNIKIWPTAIWQGSTRPIATSTPSSQISER